VKWIEKEQEGNEKKEKRWHNATNSS